MNDTPSPAAGSAPRPTAPRAGQKWPTIWSRPTLLLLVLGALLVLWRMAAVHFSGISLFFDEAQYWDWSRQLQWGYYSKPPVIAAVVGASTALFGHGVLGVKALSMLVYLATALAMVGFARALWPTTSGVRTGAVAGALFISAPMTGLLGMAASTDGPLLLCWTLAAWALWRAQVTNRLTAWVLCGLAVGVGMLTKYTMAAFAITALWTLWGVHGPRRGLLRAGPWVAALVAAAVFSPNLMWNVQWHFPTLQHTAEITTQSNRDGGFMAALTFLAGQVLMVGPMAVIAGIWLRGRWKSAGAAPLPVPPSQFGQSTQLPASQWAPTTQMPIKAEGQDSAQPEPDRAAPSSSRKPARSSAFYLASVTSYRYLVALSLPLLAVALLQSLRAGAHVNWAAPALISVFMLLATRLSPPLIPMATPRPQGWLLAVVAFHLLLAGIVIHARDVGGDRLPSRLDALVRMRGWHEAFGQLGQQLDDPRVMGLPVVADKRLLLAQASYEWRDRGLQIKAWNPDGSRGDHYQLQQSLPDKVGQDVLVLSLPGEAGHMLKRFAYTRELASVKVPVGPDRSVALQLNLARGFVGYNTRSYEEQSRITTDQVDTPAAEPTSSPSP